MKIVSGIVWGFVLFVLLWFGFMGILTYLARLVLSVWRRYQARWAFRRDLDEALQEIRDKASYLAMSDAVYWRFARVWALVREGRTDAGKELDDLVRDAVLDAIPDRDPHDVGKLSITTWFGTSVDSIAAFGCDYEQVDLRRYVGAVEDLLLCLQRVFVLDRPRLVNKDVDVYVLFRPVPRGDAYDIASRVFVCAGALSPDEMELRQYRRQTRYGAQEERRFYAFRG